MDEEVDNIYLAIVEEIIGLISEDKAIIRQGTKLLFVGRFLERIADHTTNICERVIYMVTGELKEIN
jgi:phosphate transport system protein